MHLLPLRSWGSRSALSWVLGGADRVEFAGTCPPCTLHPGPAVREGAGTHQPPSWGCRCPTALGAVVRWVRYVAESSLALAGDPPLGLAVERGARWKLVLLVSGQVFLNGCRAFWPVWLCLQESCAQLKEIESCACVPVWAFRGVLTTLSLHFASGEDLA